LQEPNLNALTELARELRLEVLEITTDVASGHVSSSYSCVEILVALYFGGPGMRGLLRYRPAQPDWPDRDRFILSKGHAAPVFYSVLARAGYFDRSELSGLRTINCRAEGHPVQGKLPGIETSTGSLGKGISVGLGHVLAGRLHKRDYQVYVLVGDGECEEGQVWEAAMAAAHFKATNLVVIVDYNKYQESGPISREMTLEPFAEKWRAFGWQVFEVPDGHDIAALIETLNAARQARGGPTVVIAHTVKGKGVSFVEADYTFHGRALTPEQAIKARKELLCL
jgi:transketolase